MARGFGGVGPVGRAPRFNFVIIGGVAVALVCVVLAFVLLSNKPTTATTQTVVVEKEAPIKMQGVLVPISDVQMGSPLEASMFRREDRPALGIGPGALRDLEEIKGMYSRSLILQGQPLLKDMITSVRPANAITANIPDGFRAVTIRVDQRTSVEGFTQPGAKVDESWTSTIKGQPAVKVIVQNAKVLSAERKTDQNVQGAGGAIPTTVTLLVSDRDAAKIQLASTTGTLSLSLRGDADPGKGVIQDKVTINDLLSSGEQVEQERTEGSVVIGGKRFKLLPGGKMIPE